MNVKRDIISKRYIADGVPLIILDETQKKYLKLFLNDGRLKYKTISACPLCQDENSILVAEKDCRAIPLKTIVCENCGLVRSLEQLDEESSNIFYSEYYRKIYEPRGELSKKRYCWGAKRKIPRYVIKDKIVLDMGCGGGWNLIPFQKAGFEYYGFDYDKEFIEWGKEKGLSVYLGGVKEAVKRGLKCDYLMLSQVLEHVSNPIDFLIGLKPLLNEKAIININVPSLDLLFWGYAAYDFLGTLQNAHNFLFDELTLKTIGRKAGFRIINCLATNLVLENSQNFARPNLNLSGLNRGKKIINYLKLLEKSLLFRKKIGADKILLKKLYCFLRPIECYKRFSMKYLGKI